MSIPVTFSLLVIYVCVSAAPTIRKSADEILEELKSIRDSVKQHADNVKFVGAIRSNAIDALTKSPQDPVLVKQVEDMFASYYHKVFDFQCGHREASVEQWMAEEPAPKAELTASLEHVKKSRTLLEGYMSDIHEVKAEADRGSGVAKTEDDRNFVLLKSVCSFHSRLPQLKSSLYELELAIAHFEQLLARA